MASRSHNKLSLTCWLKLDTETKKPTNSPSFTLGHVLNAPSTEYIQSEVRVTDSMSRFRKIKWLAFNGTFSTIRLYHAFKSCGLVKWLKSARQLKMLHLAEWKHPGSLLDDEHDLESKIKIHFQTQQVTHERNTAKLIPCIYWKETLCQFSALNKKYRLLTTELLESTRPSTRGTKKTTNNRNPKIARAKKYATH